jgi:NAD(P)-dependent dehydrogenase (short-subunit alcohol dehydrogenase family)
MVARFLDNGYSFAAVSSDIALMTGRARDCPGGRLLAIRRFHMTGPYESVRYSSLQNRNVVITGGASGIGREMVRAFAEQGARVSFIDFDRTAGTATAEETGSTFVPCDLTDVPGLRAAIGGIEARHGAIDVLVNNAARDDRHPMATVEPDYWRHVLATNLDHQFFVTQAASKKMMEAGRGSVIMFGSVSWMRSQPNMVGYTTAKAAINGLTKTLATELGPSGIRVNCIVPGAIRTERQEQLWRTPEGNERILANQALKVFLDGSHVARVALFLGSEESAGCSGANFIVDAGLR